MNLIKIKVPHIRIFGLDFMRFLAIILVLISHGHFILKPILGEKSHYLDIGGFWGVELFFVMSGFLIGTILIKIFDRSSKLTKATLIDFWKRRWFRTLPNYYLILFLNILLGIIASSKVVFSGQIFSYFTFSQNLFSEHPSFFGEAWSLAVEEWFYLLFPLILILISFVSPKSLKAKQIILVSIILMVVLPTLFRYYFASNEPLANWDKSFRKIVLLRLDSINFGVLMGWLIFYYKQAILKNKHFLLVIGLCFIVASGYFYFDNTIYLKTTTSVFSKSFLFNITTIGFGLTIPFFSEWKTINSKKLTDIITSVSIVSYSIYLIHYSIVLFVIRRLFTINSTPKAIFIYTGYLLTTYLISTLIYNLYEVKMTTLRDVEIKKGMSFKESFVVYFKHTLNLLFSKN